MPEDTRPDLDPVTRLHASLRAILDYLCAQASLADLWALQARLSHEAAQVARQGPHPSPLAGIGTLMSEIAQRRAFLEEMQLQQALMVQQRAPWSPPHGSED